MLKVAKGCKVKVTYELRVKGGDVLESSAKSGPVEYTHGDGVLLPALEKRLEGMGAGEEKSGEIPAGEAVPEDALPTRDIAKNEFPKDAAFEVGSMFQAKDPALGVIDLRVIEVHDDSIKVRMIPALAGKDLEFKVKVMRIEDPLTKTVALVTKPPPPLPAEALKLDVEPDPEA